MNKLFVGLFTAVLGTWLIFGFCPQAHCQDSEDGFMLEEITVTAEKREVSLQKTPLSITAISGPDITERGLISANEVLKDVPGIVVQGAARGFTIAIRGLGSNLPPATGESAVSTNFDGIYNFHNESGILGYFDLDRVEVLRGPQGTLYGRNATAGVVNVITKDPTDKFEGYAVAEIGNFDLVREEGMANLPLTDNVAVRMSFVNVNRDGFLSNGTSDAVGTGVRAKIGYTPAEDKSIVLTSQMTKLAGKSVGFVPADNWNNGDEYQNDTSDDAWQDVKLYRFSADMELSAGPGVVTFIPSFQYGDGVVAADTGAGLVQSDNPIDSIQYSGELRYSAPADAKTQWVAGLYYYHFERGQQSETQSFPIESSVDSYAAFGQLTVPFTETFRGVVGARAASDGKSYDNQNLSGVPTSGDNDWSSFDWKTGLEYDVSESIMAYLTLATGHRPGGFNNQAGTTFEMEELLSAEFGIKSRFLDDRMQVNGNIFYYDYSDFQLSDFFRDPDTGNPTILILNVPDVTNFGGEIETEILLGNYTRANISLTHLNSEYKSEFVLHDGTEVMDMEGETLPNAPEWSIKGGIEHTFALASGATLRPRIDFRWVDDRYVAPYPSESRFQEAYSMLDATLQYTPISNGWNLNFYVRNATDETTKTAYFVGRYLVGNPRQFGAVLKVQF